MPSFPKFGQELAEAQRRITSILDREASGNARAISGRSQQDPEDAPDPSVTQDKAQDLVSPDTLFVGPDVFPPGRPIGYQLPLTLGSYETKITVLNVDHRTGQLPTPLALDIPIELRVDGVVVATVTFNEPLAFGREVTKATRVSISDGRASGLIVSLVGINRSRYAVRVGVQFERELEL